MTLQTGVVALIVPLCALYAVWNLIGVAGRRRLGAWLARLPWPAAWQRRLAKTGDDTSACGCDGCDNAGGTAAKPGAQAIVRVHRRGH